ncbi:MAG: glycosyltransferase family 4 protein [Sedimentisphaerales bacterium]|nr:glycosyltransferase family 4 protein [Sedimentisphaerales bacterium]
MRNEHPPGAGTSLDAVTLVEPQVQEYVAGPVSFRQRLRRRFWHVLARQLTLLPLIALAVVRWIGRRRRALPREGYEILLTGRFDSKNWILNHLGPLSASERCSHVWMVSSNPVPVLPKVVAIYPPRWLTTIAGVTPARLLTFVWTALWKRPHIIGGFHVMVNGMAAVITARLVGSRSMYFCVGGPAEIRDGGIHSADSLFKRMETPDPVVERRLLRIIADSDVIVTMGSKAVTFFRERGVDADFHVVSGGIDVARFQPVQDVPCYDLILTGRLVEVKRIDVFLEAVQRIAARIPDIKVAVVGDGKLRDELHRLAARLRVDRHVCFAGHQDNVEGWLRKSKVFALTSDSEGLSLSMMEAMMCGLPAVVSDVGDLGDLVENGVNGYLVPRRSPELFADRIVELLLDDRKLAAFSQAARNSALRYTTQATVKHWDSILAGLAGT